MHLASLPVKNVSHHECRVLNISDIQEDKEKENLHQVEISNIEASVRKTMYEIVFTFFFVTQVNVEKISMAAA